MDLAPSFGHMGDPAATDVAPISPAFLAAFRPAAVASAVTMRHLVRPPSSAGERGPVCALLEGVLSGDECKAIIQGWLRCLLSLHMPLPPSASLAWVLPVSPSTLRSECICSLSFIALPLLSASEAHGFELGETFCHEYRDRKLQASESPFVLSCVQNDRFQSDDPQFSQLIWERIEQHLRTMATLSVPQHWKAGVLLRCFAHLFTQLESFNHRWRYCRYHAYDCSMLCC
jgi:hypothetical protein